MCTLIELLCTDIESYACTLYTFAILFLFAANFLISSDICSNQKLSNYVKFLGFTYKAINEFLLIYAHQDLLYMQNSLFQINYLLNKHH